MTDIEFRPTSLEAESDYGPSLAKSGGDVLVGWTASNGDIKIRRSAKKEEDSESGISGLSEPIVLEESAASSPALAYYPYGSGYPYGEKFYVAWRNEDGQVCVTTSPDGREWGSTIIMDEKTPSAPALGIEENDSSPHLYVILAWRDKDDKIRVRRTLSFLSWSKTYILDVKATGSPKIGKSRKEDQDMFWASSGFIKYSELKSSGDGDSYEFNVNSQNVILDITSGASVSDAQFGFTDDEHLAWQSQDDQEIRLASIDDAPEVGDRYELSTSRFTSVGANPVGGLALEQVGSYKFLAWTREEDNKVQLTRL
ncbi:hypothetical protein GGP50_003379 [Salinibacter ruber]|uniref:hypothetical protein n=1 Tax=Salinibacter ruber TaxID=146919 RepID=UPI00216A737D|nr:hypothetical protein [Salinibacter ruber]MCS4195138.1 hypothetical protein [Salinibacter ruber]